MNILPGCSIHDLHVPCGMYGILMSTGPLFFVLLYLDGLKAGTKIGVFSHFLRFSCPQLHAFSASRLIATTAVHKQGPFYNIGVQEEPQRENMK